ncbi:PD-(D/E)XK motif protein [Desulfonatronum parangueonense]
MAQQSEFNRLQTAWRALAGEDSEGGWRTIPINPAGPRQLLAGRHFPGNEEAILVGFNLVQAPEDKNLPQGHGFRVVNVKHRVPGDAKLWIALSRRPAGSLDMFTRMSENIISMFSDYGHVNDRQLLQLFLGRIKAWQEFMHQARGEFLGHEAEIGLFGELWLLRQLLNKGLPPAMVLDAWQGPHDGLHDFLLGTGAIEVKSTIARHGFPATIGSLEQLDPSLACPLFLAGMRFLLGEDGESLPEIVDDLSISLGENTEAAGRFETLILRWGYLRAFSDRYSRRFLHSDTRFMKVDHEFPSLTRADVDQSIKAVRYVLDLDLVSVPDIAVDMVLEELGVAVYGTH